MNKNYSKKNNQLFDYMAKETPKKLLIFSIFI